MQTMNPYLIFNGNCAEAMRFYAAVFNAPIEFMQTFGQSPGSENMPEAQKNQIMHARMTIFGVPLMASDNGPSTEYKGMCGFGVSINVDDPAQADILFAKLAENAQALTMPIQQTFWAKRFGMCTDRFGTPWMVNCE